MIVQTKPLAEVTRRAIEVLTRELEPADMARFVNQFTTGSGDYTAERLALFADKTLDQIVAEKVSREEVEQVFARWVVLPSQESP